ncbi:MAG: phosphate/phosphite/phosphonate ABC transporter substrate-binding protein [Nitrospirae bacterium]|nr:phosphate/phosphite/phosphonate ABC transporter substrate-binding protein [Nitrospirota bacterium]
MFLPLLLSSAGTVYAQEPLLFGIHPFMIEGQLHERFDPLATYLSQKIGQPIKVVVTRDYEEQIDKMGKDKFDLAYMGPAPYIKMADRYGKKSILGRFETNGKATFRGVIFVSKDSPVRSLADLRGKRFAFGDTNSTMSHLVPLYQLRKAGVPIDTLGTHAFLGRHQNVALGVLSGDFDAGAMREDIFLHYEKRGLRMLARTPEFSDHLIVASGKLPEKTVQALRKALSDLKNDNSGRAILTGVKEGATGIVAGQDNDYDSMREIVRQLEKIGIK